MRIIPGKRKLSSKRIKLGMKITLIQWCHSTVNPVMGCDGCELWPPASQVISSLVASAVGFGIPESRARETIAGRLNGLSLPDICRRREDLLSSIMAELLDSNSLRSAMRDVIKESAVCYAGLQHVLRAGHPGFADEFGVPKLFAGRMASAAGWSAPSDKEIEMKPWLQAAQRLIFISDMGDALSRNVDFEFLRREVIEAVTTPKGSRHIWLWLSKRPSRMAEFAAWLLDQETPWPENLVPMTTVTSMRTIARVDELRKIPARVRGLSCEPLWEPLHLDLEGIDWVIVGGGSDTLAPEFHVEWAHDLREQCAAVGTAFFLKQLGRHPFVAGTALKLKDGHGGDWREWDKSWRVREIPDHFKFQHHQVREK